MRTKNLLLVALGIRLAMVCYAAIHDALFALKYTDIDYVVVSDGAEAVWRTLGSTSGTPFDRVTYRYTPLLAFAMLPNVVVWKGFGKVLLSLCDVAAGGFALQALQSDRPAQATDESSSDVEEYRRKAKLLVSAFILFNPVVINVSTRGNSDMIICFLVLGCLAAFSTKRYFTAGLYIGFAIHMKIYPIVYIPALVLALLDRHCRDNLRRTGGKPVARGSGAVLDLTKAALQHPFIVDAAKACAGTIAAAAAPTALCYWLYGRLYLDEAVLYHVGRLDHRHNLSPYWYPMYLGLAEQRVPELLGRNVPQLSGAYLKGLLAFVPQLVALMAVSWVLRRNVKQAVALVTVLFVAFNKVCTVQYFVWYLPLLPFVFIAQGSRADAASSEVLAPLCPGDEAPTRYREWHVGWWFLALLVSFVLWMLGSKRLEFDGSDVFMELWGYSMLFYVLEIAVAAKLCRIARLSQLAGLPSRRLHD